MHKFAKQIMECVKAKVEAIGIDNIEGQHLEELEKWTEIAKNIVCYDKDYKIVEAMEEAEGEDVKDHDWESRIGYPRRRDSRGRFMSSKMGFVPEMYMRDEDYDIGRMYYSSGAGSRTSGDSMNGASRTSSRYGYSHDKYMNEKNNYSSTDPEDMQKRKQLLSERLDDLYSMAKEEVMDMSPEEKAMWKSKITMLMNI